MAVIALCPYGAASPERAIDGPGAADCEALSSARQLLSRVRLDDEMQMIGLHGEVQDTEAATARSGQRVA